MFKFSKIRSQITALSQAINQFSSECYPSAMQFLLAYWYIPTKEIK